METRVALVPPPAEGDAAGAPPSVKRFREALKAATAHWEAQFAQGVPAAQLVRQRAEVIDRLLQDIWRHFLPAETDEAALVAVGGYGRGELHPGSDVDVQIVLAPAARETYGSALERFLAFLWDIGLQVGQSVRTVAECVEEAGKDITVATNLMEARLLAGAPTLFDRMHDQTGPAHLWPSGLFFQAKLLEQIARHRKYHDTAYNLEPNIKEGPGGLRDIQVIGWVAKRHFGAVTLSDLVMHRFLTEEEYHTLVEGQNFLFQIRFALHVLTGRREDRLLFDYQRTLAEQFGYLDDHPNLAVEQFMKRYYRTVMELSRLNEMLLQLFEEAILYADDPVEPVRLDVRYQARKGFIEVIDDHLFQRDPSALLEIFLVLARHPELKGVRAATIRLIRHHCHLIEDRFRDDPSHRLLFMEILRQPCGVTEQLRRMNRYGVLGRYLPAFGHITGLMQYDLFHTYTVDEHTLTVIRNLRRFALPKHNPEFPLCSEIMQRHIPKPEILYLAALFHDIAKGRGGDHSTLGAEEALDFCLRHGLGQYEARLVAWLVQHHLLMSTTSQRKDTSDPDVITQFAIEVRSAIHLNHLYLLTVADIRATNPSLWNSWKDTLLLELYTATLRMLRLDLIHSGDQQERAAGTQNEARQLLLDQGLTPADLEAAWRDSSLEYFQRYSADEIAWHTPAILRHQGQSSPLILVGHQTRRGGTEIFIHTQTDDRLFARTTEALNQLGLDIVDARIIVSKAGLTQDTYIVLEDNGQPIDNPHRIPDIHGKLKDTLTHLDRVIPVTRPRPRQLKHFIIPTEVSFSRDTPHQRTVMELMTMDRPGLLSRVGQALMECGVRLHNAKVATFGARVEDVFYLTDADDRPLSSEEQFHRLRQTLVRYLDAPGPTR